MNRIASPPPVVRIVAKGASYSGQKIESSGGAELFRLNPTTSGTPGVIVEADLPKLYKVTLGSEDRYGKGMHEARVFCTHTYRDWIKDHQGLDVVVQLADESGQVLWCSDCGDPDASAIKASSIAEALHTFGHGAPNKADEILVEAHWDVDTADALTLAGWYVDNLGAQTAKDVPMQEWLADQLTGLLGVDNDQAETLAWQAAAEVAVQLGISEPDGVAYGDEGTVSDPYDLLREAAERTNGHPGQLFRDTAARLRN